MNNQECGVLCPGVRVFKQHPWARALGVVSASFAWGGAYASPIQPISYDMLNGQAGSATYYDDTYSGTGDRTVSLAELTDGLGQLTDGVLGSDNWTDNLGNGAAYEWVGWRDVNPVITFDFGAEVTLTGVRIHANNATIGGVNLFRRVEVAFSSNGVDFSQPIADVTSAEELADQTARFLDTSFPATAARFVRVQLFDRDLPADWIFISEIHFDSFNGTPVTVVTPSGDPSVPSGFFTSCPVTVHFDAADPRGGMPPSIELVSSSGIVGSASEPAPFSPLAWDYAEESPESNVWALAAEGLIFDFPIVPASEIGIVFTDGAGITHFEAWSGLGATGVRLADVVALRGQDGTTNRNFADDCFFGIKDAGEVRSIRLWSDRSGGIEADVLRVVMPTTIDAQASSICLGGSASFQATVGGGSALGYQWLLNGVPLTDGVGADGSIIVGSQTGVLDISDVQAGQAGLYSVVVTTECGEVESNAVAFDVFCDCDPVVQTAGADDGFALPRELTAPGGDLVRVLLERRPNRPFHEFDQIPGVTADVEEDSRLAHTFSGLPADIVGARLTMRVRAGGTGADPVGAEGTDSVRLGFTTAASTAASNDDQIWTRRFGNLPGEPNGLFDVLWSNGEERLLTLDLAALPVTARLGEPDPAPVSLIDRLNTNGFLDVTVVDETGVDFMTLEIERSDGRVVAWAGGSAGTRSVTGGSRAELFATGGVLGGPFTYQWWRDGNPIDQVSNPTAGTATLVLDPATGADAGEYACLVAGVNTCGGPVFSGPVVLQVLARCPADLTADGLVDLTDINTFTAGFVAMDPVADLNADGLFDLSDINAFVSAFLAGCP